MQKRSNVQDNIDITEQSFSSIPSIKLCGHFGKLFVKPLAAYPYVLLTFLLFFSAQKKILHMLPFKCFVKHFEALKWLKKIGLNFGSFDLQLFNSLQYLEEISKK